MANPWRKRRLRPNTQPSSSTWEPAPKPLLAGRPCRAEAGSAAIPRHKSNDRARVPDLMVRCSGKPTVLFEVVSPSDEKSQAEKAERYRDLRNVDGVQEIVEVEQDEFVCRVHRLRSEIDGWQMDYVSGADSTLHVASLGISVSLRVYIRGRPDA